MTNSNIPQNPFEALFGGLGGGESRTKDEFNPLDILANLGGHGFNLGDLGDLAERFGGQLIDTAESFNPAETVTKVKETFSTAPKKDLNENHKYVFPLPGVPAANVGVEILDGVLTVTAQHENFNGGAPFKQSAKLAINANVAETSSTYKDGLLVVTVPNIQPEAVKVSVKVDSE